MAKVGRNEPCPCGSGRKAKRCCGVPRGPEEAALARAYLAAEACVAALCLAGLADEALDELWEEMLELPREDLSLLFPLPKLVDPELERLLEAIVAHDAGEADDALLDLVPRLDTPHARAGLARAVVAVRDRGRVTPELAAVALLDLGGRSRAFVRASLVQAAAVAAGAVPTPAGIYLADRVAA